MLTISIGSGVKNPACVRDAGDDLAALLRRIPANVEGWWSPHVWANDRRAAAEWIGAGAIALDVDYHAIDATTGAATHAPLSPHEAARAREVWRSEALPGSLFHLTPRGCRVVFVLDETVTDRDRFTRAARGAAALLDRALRSTGLAASGFVLDPSPTADLARLLYLPNAIVKGEARSAEIEELVARDPYGVDALAAEDAPKVVVVDPGTKGDGGYGAGSVTEAAARWNAANPREYPRAGTGDCPVCGHRGCFGAMPDDPTRWYCFSTNHAGVGVKGAKGWHGDALDLASHERKIARVAILVAEGFLAPRDEAAEVLVPGAHLTDEGEYVEVSPARWAEDVLRRIPEGTLYRRDRIVGMLDGRPGRLTFRPITVERAILLVSCAVRPVKWAKKKGADGDDVQVKVFVVVDRSLASLVLEAASSHDRVRSLSRLVNYPVLVGENLDLVRPGWNDESGVFYDEPAELAGLVMSPANAKGAVEILDDLVTDFPFRDEAARAAFYGLLLTILVRPAIDGNIPAHVALASMERTGKTMLLNLAGLVTTGREIPPFQMGGHEEEREKRITALILSGETLVHLDNLSTNVELDSASVASLLTAREWKGRVLGRSEMPTLPNTLTIVASGNNVRLSAEITKRTIPVWLQPRDGEPERRTDFRHPDLKAFALASRRRVIEALLGVVAWWRDNGRPHPSRSSGGRLTIGGFGEWTHVVGGSLHAAGVTAWGANLDEWGARADDERQEMVGVVEAWWAKYGGDLVRVDQILALVRDGGHLPRLTAAHETKHVLLCGALLRRYTDRIVARWRVCREDTGRGPCFRLREIRPARPGEGVRVPLIETGSIDDPLLF
jgi:hypothetical protein